MWVEFRWRTFQLIAAASDIEVAAAEAVLHEL